MYWTSQVAIGFDNALKIRIFGEKGTLEFVQEENNYLRVSMRHEPQRSTAAAADTSEEGSGEICAFPCGHRRASPKRSRTSISDLCCAAR